MPRCINYKKCKGHVAVFEGKKNNQWVCIDCRNKDNIVYQEWIKSGKKLSFVSFQDKFLKIG